MADNEVWEIDLEKWDMEAQCLWGEALKASQDNYSPRTLFTEVAKVLKRWPFPGSSTDEKAYLRLSNKQWQEVLKRVNDAVTTFLAG